MTTMRDLVMRDPAFAAAMGAIGDDFGQDFDETSNFGEDWGADPFGADPFGFGFAAAAPHPELAAAPNLMAIRPNLQNWMTPAKPAPAQIAQAFQAQQLQSAHTAARVSLIDPNGLSATKVERYSFSINAALVLATQAALSGMTLQPNTKIRPQRVIMNAPCPMFVTLTSLQVANVNVFVGNTEDAYTYSAGAQGVVLDLPTVDPSYRVSVAGNYSGLVPPGFAIGFAYTFIATFQGPSMLIGAG